MAKLNGVNVVSVPVVAEKITYNGVEYVKTDKEAEAGDIVRHDADGYSFLPKGTYYLVVDSENGPAVFDEDGDDFGADDEDFVVFTKVSAAPALAPVTYREVKRKAEVGERIKALKDCEGFYSEGDEGIVTKVYGETAVQATFSSGNWYLGDDIGYVVLEPVDSVEIPQPSATTPDTLPDTYVIHNGKVYAKEAREAKDGDLIVLIDNRCLNATQVKPYFPNGAICVASVKGYDDDVYIRGYEAEGSYMSASRYNVLTPVTSVTLGGKEYALESRKASVGERVLITKTPADYFFSVGDIGICDGKSGWVPMDAHIEFANGTKWYAGPSARDSEYTVLVPKSDAQPSAKPADMAEPFAIGDYVKVTDASGNSSARVGDIAKVTGTWGGGVMAGIDAITADGREVDALARRFTKASAEDIAAYEKSVAISAIKPGMYAKITEYQCGDDIGTVAEITDITDFGRITYKSEKATSGTYVSGYGSYEVVSAEEAAEFERKKAEADAKALETAKWAAIGRKVGEFKAGDIVEVTDSCGGHPVGTVGVAEYGHGFMFPCWGVRANGKLKSHSGQMRLIAPVESLFNADKAY